MAEEIFLGGQKLQFRARRSQTPPGTSQPLLHCLIESLLLTWLLSQIQQKNESSIFNSVKVVA